MASNSVASIIAKDDATKRAARLRTEVRETRNFSGANRSVISPAFRVESRSAVGKERSANRAVRPPCKIENVGGRRHPVSPSATILTEPSGRAPHHRGVRDASLPFSNSPYNAVAEASSAVGTRPAQGRCSSSASFASIYSGFWAIRLEPRRGAIAVVSWPSQKKKAHTSSRSSCVSLIGFPFRVARPKQHIQKVFASLSENAALPNDSRR